MFISYYDMFTSHPTTIIVIHMSKKTRTSTYQCWRDMMRRCYNPARPHYCRYGGRGIRVCKRWHTYDNFLADMGEKPIGRTLDRRNNSGHYSKRNCRWATALEQAQNRRPYPKGVLAHRPRDAFGRLVKITCSPRRQPIHTNNP